MIPSLPWYSDILAIIIFGGFLLAVIGMHIHWLFGGPNPWKAEKRDDG